MRLLKISSIMLFTLLLVTSFQNCSQSNLSEALSTDVTKIDANDFNQISDVHTADETTSINPDPLAVGADECLPAGHVFTTNNGDPHISYRKCDGEIDQWKGLARAACCSQEATIVDSQVYSDSVCSDGKYVGVMTCK